MIPNEKIRSIVNGLLERSQKNEANWIAAPTPPGSTVVGPGLIRGRNEPNAFLLQLPASKVKIEYCSPPTEPDYVRLDFLKSDGANVGGWTVHDGEDDWPLLQDLFFEASRRGIGWDSVLDEVGGALAKPGLVGFPSLLPTPTTKLDAKDFLSWFAGTWYLQWGRAVETHFERVLIHPDGTYDRDGTPTFVIQNIDCDAEGNHPTHVSFDKVNLRGPVLDREDLTVATNDQMSGHGHMALSEVLEYRRFR